jgi:hypothetical protein
MIHYICPKCQVDPTSHSFHLLEKNGDCNVFYTCPVAATNHDTAGIIVHYDGTLIANGNTPWNWIIDCSNFGLAHMVHVRTSIEITKLLSQKHYAYLRKIKVINTNMYIRTILSIILPFMSDYIKSLIDIES